MRQEGGRSMLNLVWKDFRILKRTLWLAAPFEGFCGLYVFSFIMEGAALSFTTILVTYMLIDRACDLDARNNTEIIMNSLPVRRRDIVLAKYLSVFPYAAIAILSFVFAHGVVSFLGIPVWGGTPANKITSETFAAALVAMVAFISFYFPIYFKLGYARTKWAGMTLFFIVMIFIPVVISIIAGGVGGVSNPIMRNIIVLMGRLSNWLQTQADWQLGSYTLVLALILLSASIRLSLRFYTRREF